MLNHGNNTVETQLGQKTESLEKEIKSLRKRNWLNSSIIGLGVIGLMGYIIATNWSAIAPAPATATTVTAAPVIRIVIGAIIGATVLVGASYAAWRYRAEIRADFKYTAEKTVEGTKHTAGKIKASAMYAKDSVREAVSSLKQVEREETSSALEKMGEGIQNLGRKMSGIGASISDLERIPYLMEPQEPQGVVLLAKRKPIPDLIDSNRDLERDSLQSNSLSKSSSKNLLNSNNTDGSEAPLLDPKKHKKAPTSFWNRFSSPFKSSKKSEQHSVLPGSGGEVPPVTVDSTHLRRNSSSGSLYNGFPVPTPVVPPEAPKSSTTNGSNSGKDSSGSSMPIEGQETSLEALQNGLEQRFTKLCASLNQPNAEPVNPGVMHNK